MISEAYRRSLRYNILREVEYRHNDCKAVGKQIRRDECFEYPFEDIERVKFVHIVFLQNHLNQLIHKHKGKYHSGNGNNDGFR